MDDPAGRGLTLSVVSLEMPTHRPSAVRRRRPALTAVLVAAATLPVLLTAQPRVPVPFVPPARTDKVADGARTATIDAGYGRKFAVENSRPKVTISNPFMDPQRPFFARAESIRCAADGRVVVSGRAGFDKDARAVASGLWQIAPDGAVTPLAARDNNKVGGPACGSAFAQSSASPARFSLTSDGRVIFAGEGSIQAVTGDAQVVRVAGAVGECSGQPRTRGFVDGDADGARFSSVVGRPVEDTDGNLWVADQDACALRKIDRNGRVTTVLGKDALCNDAIPPEDQPLLHELAWDAAHGELVAAGSRTVARPVHDLYTLVFRIAPDGTTKRVLFGKKVTRVSPSKHHLDGVRAMTVDAKGRILLVSQLMIFEQRGFDVLQLMRVDEPNATVEMLSGTKIPKGTWLAEYPYDGPLDRAYFEGTRDMCAAPDGTIYVNDDILIRKIDPKGVVTTWAF